MTMDTTRQALPPNPDDFRMHSAPSMEVNWTAFSVTYARWREQYLAALTSMDAAPQGVVEAGDAMAAHLAAHIMTSGLQDIGEKKALRDWDAAKSRTTPAVALRSGEYGELYSHLADGGEALGLTDGLGLYLGRTKGGECVMIGHKQFFGMAYFNEECTRLALQYILIQPEQK